MKKTIKTNEITRKISFNWEFKLGSVWIKWKVYKLNQRVLQGGNMGLMECSRGKKKFNRLRPLLSEGKVYTKKLIKSKNIKKTW